MLLHDALLQVSSSPIVALNRAVAVGMARGSAAELLEPDSVQDDATDSPAETAAIDQPDAEAEAVAAEADAAEVDAPEVEVVAAPEQVDPQPAEADPTPAPTESTAARSDRD